jgi:hypothetical protein
MMTDALISAYTAMETFVIELPICTPLRRLYQDPVREYVRRNTGKTDAEMRDDPVDAALDF